MTFIPSSASDPSFEFPPIQQPAETTSQTLGKVEAAGDLSMKPCEDCGARPVVIAWNGDLPRAVEYPHAVSCAVYSADE
ncbi:MAG: hypothetical protein V4531_08470 [Actinomycetota bacterium]